MKKGYVIEFNVRGQDGRIYPDVVLTSEQYGKEVFDHLTEGENAGASFDKNLEGIHDAGSSVVNVIYDRAFVILP